MAYGNYAPFYRGGFFNPIQTPTMPQMADNQGQFAQPYQPMQTNPSPMQMQTQQTNDMIWVLNENEATSYPVAPNNSVVFESGSVVIQIQGTTDDDLEEVADRLMKMIARKQQIQNMAIRT